MSKTKLERKSYGTHKNQESASGATHARAKGKTRSASPTQSRSTRTNHGASLSKKGRDPEGGLTAEGRREFARKEGSHLKPGVRKSESSMTGEEMRRKGSWAVRFYGREGKLPPLKDKNGKPTRYALSAHAWGEPVPKTEAAARKIAAKGKRLLEKAKKSAEK